MQAPAIIIAETATRGTENLPFLIAMLGVILSLIALFRISMIKPRADHHRSTTPPPAAQRHPARAADIPPEIVAVIAAAVASITGNKPVHIISIKPMSTSWERAGRQSVLTSHRIR